jgi:hypothetical protein
MRPLPVVVRAVLLPSTTWCIPHLGVSCVDRKSNRTRVITHNSNHGNSSSNSRNSSTVLLPHRHSRLQSGHQSRIQTVAFQASTMESWDISLVSASCQSKALHQKGPQRGPAPRTGRANYTNVDEIPIGEVVLAGMFFLNERHIIILFDSGASHDFMSITYAKKAKLSLVASGAPYVISTPGG